jgi:hypothetical protein
MIFTALLPYHPAPITPFNHPLSFPQVFRQLHTGPVAEHVIADLRAHCPRLAFLALRAPSAAAATAAPGIISAAILSEVAAMPSLQCLDIDRSVLASVTDSGGGGGGGGQVPKEVAAAVARVERERALDGENAVTHYST